MTAVFLTEEGHMSQASIGTTSRHWPARMRRRQASEYLFEEHGVSLSPATLAKLAVVGGGPSFRKDGPFPLYERPGLDTFAAARLGPLRTSTSDQQQAA
jgi:hypothetical protein